MYGVTVYDFSEWVDPSMERQTIDVGGLDHELQDVEMLVQVDVLPSGGPFAPGGVFGFVDGVA